jgi:hypothetical protein
MACPVEAGEIGVRMALGAKVGCVLLICANPAHLIRRRFCGLVGRGPHQPMPMHVVR